MKISIQQIQLAFQQADHLDEETVEESQKSFALGVRIHQ
jgi:hypothetical protein